MIYFIAAIILLLYYLYKNVPVWLRTNRVLQQEIGALKEKLKETEQDWVDSQQHVTELIEQKRLLLHQKKSSEVKTGAIVEQLASFLEDFPYPEDEIKGLFQPVDLIVFRENEVVFVEVKSGDSQLSDKQRKIRDMIEAGKVRFEVHRVNGKGYKIK